MKPYWMKRFLGYILFVAPLLLFSCEVKMPEDIIPPAKMEVLLYDYHLVQSMSSEYASDDYKEKLYFTYVFDKHNVTQDEFEHSMQWYNRYPKHMKRIYANLEERLDAEVEAMSASGISQDSGVSLDVVSLDADTVELWAGSGNRILCSNLLDSHLSFSFETPSDSSFMPGDSIVFSFNALFVNEGRDYIKQKAHAGIFVKYVDGTAGNYGLDVGAGGINSLAVKRNSDAKLESMSGFVYYTDNDSLSKAKMLLSDISVKKIKVKSLDNKVDEK